MAKSVLIMMVILLLCGGLAAIGYVLLSTTVVAPRMKDAAETMQAGAAPGFGVLRVYYHDSTGQDICSITEKHIIILELLFKTDRLPDGCDIFVDSRFDKHVPLYEVPCGDSCRGQEMKLAIDLKRQDPWQPHSFRICCDSICTEAAIEAVCS